MRECDVLVVGGGPAGCSAAAGAAEKGFKTILIEEHEEIGKPVECAEGIGSYLMPLMPFEIPQRLLEWNIKGMEFFTEKASVTRTSDYCKGWSIDREKFDKWLAEKASSKGAKIHKNTELVSLEKNGRYPIKTAYAEKGNETVEFSPNYVIAADGPKSTVAKLMGLPVEDFTLGRAVNFEATGRIPEPEYEKLFFGEFAPNAYAFIFPKSKRKANVGAAGVGVSEEEMRENFDVFLESELFKERMSVEKIGKEKTGIGPIHFPDFRWNYENVFFVGDAANQTIKPFIEGTLPSVICGWILGKKIREFKEKNNYRNFVNHIFRGIYSESKEIEKIYSDLTTHKSILLFSGLEGVERIKGMEDKEALVLAKKWNESTSYRFKQKLMSKINSNLLKLSFYARRRKF